MCLCVCVCLSFCLSVCLSVNVYLDYLKKLGRMIYNDKRHVPFEDWLNRLIRTDVIQNPISYFLLLRPFDNIFLIFYYGRGEMQLAY